MSNIEPIVSTDSNLGESGAAAGAAAGSAPTSRPSTRRTSIEILQDEHKEKGFQSAMEPDTSYMAELV